MSSENEPQSQNNSETNTEAPLAAGNLPLRAAPKAVPSLPDDGAPFAAAMQSLFSLAGMMRTLSSEPAGSQFSPQVVLSGTGVEIRFANPGGTTESVPAEVAATPEQLLRLERNLKVLGIRVTNLEKDPGANEEWYGRIEKELRDTRQAQAALMGTVSELQAQIASQNETIESLRAAVMQNEQTMETLVDSMSIMEDLGEVALGRELVIPDSLAG